MLMKHAPHISIPESYNATISAMSNSFHNIVSKTQSEKCLFNLYFLALKLLCVYCKSLPYTIVKKDWGHKGVQSHDANTGDASVDENAHLG